MRRTPEQVAADDALTAAIEQVTRVYAEPDKVGQYVLAEYIVVAASLRYADDGENVTAVSTMTRDGDVAAHRCLGLLDYAHARMRAYVTDDDDD